MGHTAVAMGNGGMLIMFNYEKRLEFPINIKQTNAQMATAIITQFGGPNGETGAAMRYLSQRYAMPFDELKGLLTDIGTGQSPCSAEFPARQAGFFRNFQKKPF